MFGSYKDLRRGIFGTEGSTEGTVSYRQERVAAPFENGQPPHFRETMGQLIRHVPLFQASNRVSYYYVGREAIGSDLRSSGQLRLVHYGGAAELVAWFFQEFSVSDEFRSIEDRIMELSVGAALWHDTPEDSWGKDPRKFREGKKALLEAHQGYRNGFPADLEFYFDGGVLSYGPPSLETSSERKVAKLRMIREYGTDLHKFGDVILSLSAMGDAAWNLPDDQYMLTRRERTIFLDGEDAGREELKRATASATTIFKAQYLEDPLERIFSGLSAAMVNIGYRAAEYHGVRLDLVKHMLDHLRSLADEHAPHVEIESGSELERKASTPHVDVMHSDHILPHLASHMPERYGQNYGVSVDDDPIEPDGPDDYDFPEPELEPAVESALEDIAEEPETKFRTRPMMRPSSRAVRAALVNLI